MRRSPGHRRERWPAGNRMSGTATTLRIAVPSLDRSLAGPADSGLPALRLPAAEWLVARGDRTPEAPASWREWLLDDAGLGDESARAIPGRTLRARGLDGRARARHLGLCRARASADRHRSPAARCARAAAARGGGVRRAAREPRCPPCGHRVPPALVSRSGLAVRMPGRISSARPWSPRPPSVGTCGSCCPAGATRRVFERSSMSCRCCCTNIR